MVLSRQRRFKRGPSLAPPRFGSARPAADQDPARAEPLPLRDWTLVYFLVALSFVAILISVASYTPTADAKTDSLVKDDLRRAFEAAGRVREDSGSYRAFAISSGGPSDSLRFQPSQGVALRVEVEEDRLRIVGEHQSSTSKWCLSSISKIVVQGEDC